MKKIGLCVTGSFCTFSNLLTAVDALVDAGYEIVPVFSYNVSTLDTRFFKQADFEKYIVEKTGKTPIKTIVEAETITKSGIELMLVAPCTGNYACENRQRHHRYADYNGSKSNPAHKQARQCCLSRQTTRGSKRQKRRVALNTKNLYLVPFGQDAPDNKPHSLIADVSLILPTIEKALNHEQIQPVIL